MQATVENMLIAVAYSGSLLCICANWVMVAAAGVMLAKNEISNILSLLSTDKNDRGSITANKTIAGYITTRVMVVAYNLLLPKMALKSIPAARIPAIIIPTGPSIPPKEEVISFTN